MNDPRTNNNELPPWSEVNERAALSCILYAGLDSQQEVDALLLKLRPHHFYDARNKGLHAAMTKMRMEGHAVDMVTLKAWMAEHDKELAKAWPAADLAVVMQETASYVSFAYFLQELDRMADRRRALRASAELALLARNDQVKSEDLKNKFGELYEKSARQGETARPLLEVWTVGQFLDYQPDPRTYMVGDDMICHGDITVLAGAQGVGKSRLVHTLAYAGSIGEGHWMGYTVRRKWKTLVIQSENNPGRIKSEMEGWDPKAGEYVRITTPTVMHFSDPAFRGEIRRYWENWKFEMVIIDNMNDVSKDEGRADYIEALENIRGCFPPFPDMPAIVILAHNRKFRGGENWKPTTGRQLMHEISGSLVLSAKARTAFAVQPVVNDLDDPRSRWIVFECTKSNNDKPLPRSAWEIAPRHFNKIEPFDFDTWLNPPSNTDSKSEAVTAKMIEIIFEAGPIERKKAVEKLRAMSGLAESTAYKYFDGGKTPQGGKFKDLIGFNGETLHWKG